MNLEGREVEINVPGSPAHGMWGQITEQNGDSFIVSLHGESERHEGSVMAFHKDDLLFLATPEHTKSDAVLTLLRYFAAFCVGVCVGAIVTRLLA